MDCQEPGSPATNRECENRRLRDRLELIAKELEEMLRLIAADRASDDQV